MPKVVFICRYLKNEAPAHLSNLINYMGTREGVEKVADESAMLPATYQQKQMVDTILKTVIGASRMHEYDDYYLSPTRENADEFIQMALEQNADMFEKRRNFTHYLGNRPGVEKIDSHGLFSDSGSVIELAAVAREVASYKGVVYSHVLSLRREDAKRLGYDNVGAWQSYLRSKKAMLAENMKIDVANLNWYAAFHNANHHPHVHIVVFSKKENDGYLTKKCIENMRSEFAHDLFREEFMEIYSEQTKRRDELKSESRQVMRDLIEKMETGICESPNIEKLLLKLSGRLQKTYGKKVYGYLKADVKAIIDEIVNELQKDDRVSAAYDWWYEMRSEILRSYADNLPEKIPLSQQKEFKSIKNMVITEALSLGSHHIAAQDQDETQANTETGSADNNQTEPVFSSDEAEKQLDTKASPVSFAVTSLMRHLANIFRDENMQMSRHNPLGKIDRKRMQELRRKKQGQGYAEDDHIQSM